MNGTIQIESSRVAVDEVKNGLAESHVLTRASRRCELEISDSHRTQQEKTDSLVAAARGHAST